MNLRKSILVIIFGFFIGVFTNSFLNLDYYFGLLLVFFGLIFLFAHFLNIGNKKFYIIISILLIGIALGVLRYEIKDSRNAAFDNLINQKIIFEGIITEEPQETENYTKLIVHIKNIQKNLKIGPPILDIPQNQTYVRFWGKTQNQKILIYSRLYPKFNYGDKILITGKLQKPQKFSFNSGFSETTENYQFDWPAYLAKDNIYYQIFYPQIEFISDHNGSFIKEKLFAFKNSFVQNLEKTIPSPASSLITGIVIGEKQSLPKNLKNDLIKTGLIHIVVLSGYNITIIASAIMNIFKIFLLPRFFAAIFGTLGIILFTLMTGAEAATVRAAIMALLVILSIQTGRMYAAINALIFAAFFMVAVNPAILRFDASFQLSFLATLGMIYFVPKFEKILYFVPNKFKIKENLSATLGAQTAVFPLLIYKTGIISIVSTPLNMFILPLMPITMFLGFLTGGLGFLSYYLSYFLGIVSYVLLGAVLWIIKFSASLPFSYINF